MVFLGTVPLGYSGDCPFVLPRGLSLCATMGTVPLCYHGDCPWVQKGNPAFMQNIIDKRKLNKQQILERRKI